MLPGTAFLETFDGTGLHQPDVLEWRTAVPVVHERKVFKLGGGIEGLRNNAAGMQSSGPPNQI